MDKQKYEREIEEILAKYDKESDRKPRADRPARPAGNYPPSVPGRYARSTPNRQLIPSSWKRASSGQYMAAAFGVAFLAVFVQRFLPLLAFLLAILAVVLFFVPIALYRSTGTTSGGWGPTEQKRWRGQVIDFNTRRDITDDPLAGIKRWLRRR
jgi:hypothetical protein